MCKSAGRTCGMWSATPPCERPFWGLGGGGGVGPIFLMSRWSRVAADIKPSNSPAPGAAAFCLPGNVARIPLAVLFRLLLVRAISRRLCFGFCSVHVRLFWGKAPTTLFPATPGAIKVPAADFHQLPAGIGGQPTVHTRPPAHCGQARDASAKRWSCCGLACMQPAARHRDPLFSVEGCASSCAPCCKARIGQPSSVEP